MRDLPLFNVVRTALLSRLAARGIVIDMRQSMQPTAEGIPEGPCLFAHLVTDVRHGWPQRKDQWNADAEEFQHVESEQMLTTLQFSAQAPRNPADLTALTPGDYAKAAAAAMQSDVFLADLRAAGVGVLRIGQVRTGYTTGDRDEFDPDPSFDVTFTHRDETVEVIRPIESLEIEIHRV